MQNLRGGTKNIGRLSVDAKLVINSRLKRDRVEGSPATPSPKRVCSSLNVYSKEERKKSMPITDTLTDTLAVDPKQAGVRGSPAKLTPRRANKSLNFSSPDKRKEKMSDDVLAEHPKRATMEGSPVTLTPRRANKSLNFSSPDKRKEKMSDDILAEHPKRATMAGLPVTPSSKRANTSLNMCSTEKKKVFHRPKVLIKTEPGIISDDALVADPKSATVEGSPVTPKTKRANTSLNSSSKENQKVYRRPKVLIKTLPEKSPDDALAEDPKRARVERSPVTPAPKRANTSRNMTSTKKNKVFPQPKILIKTEPEKSPDDALVKDPKIARFEGSPVTPSQKGANASLYVASTEKRMPQPKVFIKTEPEKSPDDALPKNPKRARVEGSPITPSQNASINIASTEKRMPRPKVFIKTEPEKSPDDALPKNPKRARVEVMPITPSQNGANASINIASTEKRMPRPKVVIKTEPEEMPDNDLGEDIFATNPVPIAVCIPRSTLSTVEQPQLQCSTPLRCEPQSRTPLVCESSINIKEATITPSNSLERNSTLCKYILSELRSLSDRDATALRQSLNKTMYDFMENVSTP